MLPFFRALKSLNVYTDKHSNIKNRMAYPFRFISILPKAAPIVLDVGVALAMGSIGMSGGVYGALIGLSIGFTASLLLKIHRHFISPRIKTNKDSWKLA
jgi:hypothetical protein